MNYILTVISDHPIICAIIVILLLYLCRDKDKIEARKKEAERNDKINELWRDYKKARKEANNYISRFEKSELANYIVSEIKKEINVNTISSISGNSSYFYYYYQYRQSDTRFDSVSIGDKYDIGNKAMEIALTIAVSNLLGIRFNDEPEMVYDDYGGSPSHINFEMKRTPTAVQLKSPI